MEEDSENTIISIKCGELNLEVNRNILIKESGYFRTLLEGSYADSANLEHTVHPEMVAPEILQSVVEWLVQGEPSNFEDWTVQTILQTAHACEVLQMETILKRLLEVAASKLNPNHCLLDVKHYCFPSPAAEGFMKVLWNSVQWHFFELIWEKEILSQFTEAELYWILRNPNIVEPTGGVFALILIEAYVQLCFPNFGQSREASDSSSEAISMTARLVFALLESIESRTMADPPEDYVPRAILPRTCDGNCAECPKDEISVSENGDQHMSANNVTAQQISEGSETAALPKFSLPLLYKDVQIIEQLRQDMNCFKLMYNNQKKTPWKACFVDRTQFGPPVQMEIPSKLPTEQELASHTAPLWLYNEETQNFEQEISKLSIPCGARLCVYGHDLLVVGGELNFIGSNKFCSCVQRYNFLTRKWTKIQITKPLRHRSFNFCWLESKGLLLQGGYTEFRLHSYSVALLKEACSSLDYDIDKEVLNLHENGARSLKRPINEEHTFKYHETLTLTRAEFSSQHYIGADEKIIFTSGAHVCLLFDDSMNIYCPAIRCWRDYSLLLWPSGGPYIGAFPYGSGVYAVGIDLRVYFIPLYARRTRDGDKSGDERKDGFHMYFYSRFKSCGSQLCRVQDKLYLSGQQINDEPPVVEVMHLRYDPLEIPKNPQPGCEASVPSGCNSHCASSRVSSLPSATSSADANATRHHSGSNCEEPAPPQSRSTDEEQGGETCRGSKASCEINDTEREECTPGSHSTATDAHPPAQPFNGIHRSTPPKQRVLPDVLPTAASIRRAAAPQHRLVDGALLHSITSFFGTTRKLTPAGDYAEFLIKKMKECTRLNWVISDPRFSLIPVNRLSEAGNVCLWCKNFGLVRNLLREDLECSPLREPYIERPQFSPPLVPLPGCNAFTILKN